MTQNYKSAYPTEFRRQMVELVASGKCPKQLSKEFGCHFDTSMVLFGGRTLWIKPDNCPGFGIDGCFLE